MANVKVGGTGGGGRSGIGIVGGRSFVGGGRRGIGRSFVKSKVNNPGTRGLSPAIKVKIKRIQRQAKSGLISYTEASRMISKAKK